MTEEKEHSILSPSSAKRRKLCVASLAACKGIVEDRSTKKAASLGTAKHALGTWCLENPERQSVDAHVGQTTEADGHTFNIDDEFADHVNMYVNSARALGGDQTYEEWVSTEPLWGIPGQGGTLDLSAVHIFDGVLDIGDAKFGFTPVAVKENEQLDIYAAAKLAKIDPERKVFDKIRFHIFQPKLSDQPQTWECTRDELDARIAELRVTEVQAFALYMTGSPEKIEAAKSPSDEACEWCPIRLTCAARLNQLAGEFPITTAPVVDRPITYDPGQMSVEQLDHALSRVDYVEKFIHDWASNLRAEGLRRAHLGAFPGWKVISGKKGARGVLPADTALFEMIVAADLGEAAYEKPKLKSPTQLDATYKRLKRSDEWAVIQAGYVIQAPGAPSLARTTEPGMPLAESIAGEFDLVGGPS